MIDILNCDIKSMNNISSEFLDTPVSFDSGGYEPDFICSIGDIKYTYMFCKRLLEMCRDAGYID